MLPLLGARTTVRVRRWESGAYATSGEQAGEYVRGAKTIITIRAAIQPLSPSDLKLLPENERSTARLKMYAAVEPLLRTADAVGNEVADEVEYEGKWWLVGGRSSYPDGVIPLRHIRYVLRKPEVVQ